MVGNNKFVLNNVVKLSGVGLHTGHYCHMEIRNGVEGSGVIFYRTDLGYAAIEATLDNVFSTQRGTTLKKGDASVNTIEHLLSALRALYIFDVEVYLDGAEIPILDGSAQYIYDAIVKTGLTKTDVCIPFLDLQDEINYKDPDTGSEYKVIPQQDPAYDVTLDFENSLLNNQNATLSSFDKYRSDIAPCRTFVFLSEIEPLFDAGLIKGGDLENAIVIVDITLDADRIQYLQKKLNKPNMSIQDGVLNTTQLLFKNEPARHKLLDLIGDVFLVGKAIRGKIIAKKPGHTSNIRFAKYLMNKSKNDIICMVLVGLFYNFAV